jgi:hypothetical protein
MHMASGAAASTKQAACAASGADLPLPESGPFAAAVSVAAAAAADTPAAAIKPPCSPYMAVQSVVYGKVAHSPYVAVKSLVCGEAAMRSIYVDVRSVTGNQDPAGCCHYVI